MLLPPSGNTGREIGKDRNQRGLVQARKEGLQYAFKKGFILTNPADRVERPKKGTYVHSFYNKEEVELLLKKLK